LTNFLIHLLGVSQAEWSEKLVFQFTKVISCLHVVTSILFPKSWALGARWLCWD